jgi:polyisoprenoid-binding protein YceI
MTTAVQIPVAGAYRIDVAASTISFTTKHMLGLGTVRGTFALRDGHVEVADPVGDSSVRATVAAGSVDTGHAMRDGTVRSATYLDAERHPYFVFASTGLEQVDGGWVLRGTLTVRGVSRSIDVDVVDVRVVGSGVRVVATAVVDRYAFGITAMPGLTGRRLSLRLELVAEK